MESEGLDRDNGTACNSIFCLKICLEETTLIRLTHVDFMFFANVT
jgi:hypothetical protein